jgi:hypothetical protein
LGVATKRRLDGGDGAKALFYLQHGLLARILYLFGRLYSSVESRIETISLRVVKRA